MSDSSPWILSKMNATKSLMVCAGDVSADQHAARLLTRLKKGMPDLTIFGVGGSSMAEAGVDLLHNCEKFSCLGLIENIKFLPFLAALRAELLACVGKRKPDC